MIKDALQSDGVEEIFKLGEESRKPSKTFLMKTTWRRLDKIKMPNTKIKLLATACLAKAIGEMRKVNRVKGSRLLLRKMEAIGGRRYNDRRRQRRFDAVKCTRKWQNALTDYDNGKYTRRS